MKTQLVLLLTMALLTPTATAQTTVRIATPMTPPSWALLERALLKANTDACLEFYNRYFDNRGWLLCVERWGGDDGPDDAIENCNDWPLLHALGAPNVVLKRYRKAWEGHLRQYTVAKTTKVPLARDGMYYKEFVTQMDWVHNGEGLTVFNLQGLGDPNNSNFRKRVVRFAGFYMNEDPGALNYDYKHKIIRSMFNGSRGPLLRKATGLDWAGDPIEVENRFELGHGEKTYAQMVAHFKDYNDIIGDHPQNLGATSLALNAYMLTGKAKYKRWMLDYVDAWLKRMKDNGYIIPTNIGLDGKIGSAAGGKWYGGVYGWGFSVEVPQHPGTLAHRNTHYLGFTGFMNAYMLTGRDKYLDGWRRQIKKINSLGKKINGRMMYPRMYGDKGWYNYTPAKYTSGALEIYYLSQKPADRKLVSGNGWLQFLDGKNPNYPEAALRAELATIRSRVQGMRADKTTPDTRLSDDPMKYNPAAVHSLIHLMLGGLHPQRVGRPLSCRLRYFDPQRRRAGIPQDVAALVHSMKDDQVTVTLVNTNQLQGRVVTVQAGGYAEHQFLTVQAGKRVDQVQATTFDVRLAPGCGQKLTIRMKRFTNQPSMLFPWDR